MADPDAHASAETAYREVFTLVHDLGEGRDVAWIAGAIWPPVGTVVELEEPKRAALVVAVRLVLSDTERAVIRVDVQDPGEGELIPREAEAELVATADVPDTIEPLVREAPPPS